MSGIIPEKQTGSMCKTEYSAVCKLWTNDDKKPSRCYLCHIIVIFLFGYAIWTSYEISRLKSDFRELHDTCRKFQLTESETNGFSQDGSSDLSSRGGEAVLSLEDDVARLIYDGGRGIRSLTDKPLKRVTDKPLKLVTDKPLKRVTYKPQAVKATIKKKSRKRGRGRKKRKRRCKCIGQRGPQGPPGKTGPPGRIVEHKPKTKAVHFVAKKPRFDGICTTMWNGTSCQNYTFWSPHKKQVMQFFQVKQWNAAPVIESPLRKLSTGEFEASDSGLYLFYLNVAKYVKDPQEHIGVYVNENRILHCIDSIDDVKHSDISAFFNAKEKTCSLMGLHYITSGDKISVKIVSRDTAVVMREDETNFGAVLLS